MAEVATLFGLPGLLFGSLVLVRDMVDGPLDFLEVPSAVRRSWGRRTTSAKLGKSGLSVTVATLAFLPMLAADARLHRLLC
jgi:hypothetical protein